MDGTSGEVIMKLMVDDDDFVFKQYEYTLIHIYRNRRAYAITSRKGSYDITVNSTC